MENRSRTGIDAGRKLHQVNGRRRSRSHDSKSTSFELKAKESKILDSGKASKSVADRSKPSTIRTARIRKRASRSLSPGPSVRRSSTADVPNDKKKVPPKHSKSLPLQPTSKGSKSVDVKRVPTDPAETKRAARPELCRSKSVENLSVPSSPSDYKATVDESRQHARPLLHRSKSDKNFRSSASYLKYKAWFNESLQMSFAQLLHPENGNEKLQPKHSGEGVSGSTVPRSKASKTPDEEVVKTAATARDKFPPKHSKSLPAQLRSKGLNTHDVEPVPPPANTEKVPSHLSGPARPSSKGSEPTDAEHVRTDLVKNKPVARPRLCRSKSVEELSSPSKDKDELRRFARPFLRRSESDKNIGSSVSSSKYEAWFNKESTPKLAQSDSGKSAPKHCRGRVHRSVSVRLSSKTSNELHVEPIQVTSNDRDKFPPKHTRSLPIRQRSKESNALGEEGVPTRPTLCRSKSVENLTIAPPTLNDKSPPDESRQIARPLLHRSKSDKNFSSSRSAVKYEAWFNESSQLSATDLAPPDNNSEKLIPEHTSERASRSVSSRLSAQRSNTIDPEQQPASDRGRLAPKHTKSLPLRQNSKESKRLDTDNVRPQANFRGKLSSRHKRASRSLSPNMVLNGDRKSKACTSGHEETSAEATSNEGRRSERRSRSTMRKSDRRQSSPFSRQSERSCSRSSSRSNSLQRTSQRGKSMNESDINPRPNASPPKPRALRSKSMEMTQPCHTTEPKPRALRSKSMDMTQPCHATEPCHEGPKRTNLRRKSMDGSENNPRTGSSPPRSKALRSKSMDLTEPCHDVPKPFTQRRKSADGSETNARTNPPPPMSKALPSNPMDTTEPCYNVRKRLTQRKRSLDGFETNPITKPSLPKSKAVRSNSMDVAEPSCSVPMRNLQRRKSIDGSDFGPTPMLPQSRRQVEIKARSTINGADIQKESFDPRKSFAGEFGKKGSRLRNSSGASGNIRCSTRNCTRMSINNLDSICWERTKSEIASRKSNGEEVGSTRGVTRSVSDGAAAGDCQLKELFQKSMCSVSQKGVQSRDLESYRIDAGILKSKGTGDLSQIKAHHHERLAEEERENEFYKSVSSGSRSQSRDLECFSLSSGESKSKGVSELESIRAKLEIIRAKHYERLLKEKRENESEKKMSCSSSRSHDLESFSLSSGDGKSKGTLELDESRTKEHQLFLGSKPENEIHKSTSFESFAFGAGKLKSNGIRESDRSRGSYHNRMFGEKPKSNSYTASQSNDMESLRQSGRKLKSKRIQELEEYRAKNRERLLEEKRLWETPNQAFTKVLTE